MKKILLASAAALALLAAAPALAADDNGRHGGGHRGDHGGTTPDTTPAAPATTPAAAPATAPTPPPGAPAMIPGTPILAQPPGGQNGADRSDRGGDHRGTGGATTNSGAPTGGGTDTHGRHDNNGRDNNGGANAGGRNPFGTDRAGRHSGRNHNDGFDALRRAFNAPRHYRHGRYHRPHGWYAHRWTFGEILPSLFFSSRSYWISDYSDYDLPYPPPGTRWVRYGDDALLIDRNSGEIIQVVYGIFY